MKVEINKTEGSFLIVLIPECPIEASTLAYVDKMKKDNANVQQCEMHVAHPYGGNINACFTIPSKD